MRFFVLFVKITGWAVQKLCFRTKIVYEDKAAQSRRIKGKAIIVSNHTSVYDYAVMIFVFFWRTLRYQMAEVLFKKRLLKTFLKAMGGIFIDRYAHDFSHVEKSVNVLDRGGVVGIFPEGRLPREGEAAPLEFKEGAAYLALRTRAPIIPVYTNGSYFNKKRAVVVIGRPVDAESLIKADRDERENLKCVSEYLRQKIIGLSALAEAEKK